MHCKSKKKIHIAAPLNNNLKAIHIIETGQVCPRQSHTQLTSTYILTTKMVTPPPSSEPLLATIFWVHTALRNLDELRIVWSLLSYSVCYTWDCGLEQCLEVLFPYNALYNTPWVVRQWTVLRQWSQLKAILSALSSHNALTYTECLKPLDRIQRPAASGGIAIPPSLVHRAVCT